MRWLKKIFGVKDLESRISDLEGKIDLYNQILKETNLKIDSNYLDIVKRLDRVENRTKRYIGRKLKEFLKKD